MIQVFDIKFRWRLHDPLVINLPKLTVEKGECLFLSGSSGSGKSTLLSLLGGVIAPESGKILMNEENIVSMAAKDRDIFRANHLGLLFQMFNLMPFLSILKNVTLPCRFSPIRRERAVKKSGSIEAEAKRLLQHMGIDSGAIGNRSVNFLSAGQQQRVAAARALLGNPEFIIADEPTSSLDSGSRHAFLELLFREVKTAGTTMVFVSHDNDLASSFDRSISLNAINLPA